MSIEEKKNNIVAEMAQLKKINADDLNISLLGASLLLKDIELVLSEKNMPSCFIPYLFAADPLWKFLGWDDKSKRITLKSEIKLDRKTPGSLYATLEKMTASEQETFLGAIPCLLRKIFGLTRGAFCESK